MATYTRWWTDRQTSSMTDGTVSKPIALLALSGRQEDKASYLVACIYYKKVTVIRLATYCISVNSSPSEPFDADALRDVSHGRGDDR